ncbi:MAG TPA: sigma-70 family RNA polymerase sigma factor [Gemmatimonadota bacterium]|jgi:RNA polymerase primary sigma factor
MARRKTAARPAEHDDGPLELYFQDIRRYALLTRDEEIELGHRIRAGDQGAVDELVRSNLRFVVSVSKRYQDFGVPLPDLIAEGNVGLVRAAHLFDPNRGVRFISYAVWWIRQAIHRVLKENSRIARRTIRLEAPLFDDDDAVSSVFDADAAPSAEERTLDRARGRAIRRAIATLEPRERNVLGLYFGLDGSQPLTLEEIGTIYGLSRERIRQIKERGLGRLRNTRRGRRLEPFRT